MARSNKYTSINFNHIYEKNLNTAAATNPNNATNPTKHPSSSSSSSTFYSRISSSSPNNLYKNQLPSTRANGGGRMLVLTLPASKPLSASSTPPLSLSPQTPLTQKDIRDKISPDPEPESDLISLRPLGRTGTGSSASSLVIGLERDKKVADKFVPPHLRPGFAGREERPGTEVFRAKETGQRQQQHHHHHQQGNFGYQGRHGMVERPRSSGNERIRRSVDSDLGLMNRPGSSGTGPI
uniref:Uncharacterized protein n=1 Tax=Rhizophora mucronata TaxID=61149 RepID=A0A2P2J528_RHIMU